MKKTIFKIFSTFIALAVMTLVAPAANRFAVLRQLVSRSDKVAHLPL